MILERTLAHRIAHSLPSLAVPPSSGADSPALRFLSASNLSPSHLLSPAALARFYPHVSFALFLSQLDALSTSASEYSSRKHGENGKNDDASVGATPRPLLSGREGDEEDDEGDGLLLRECERLSEGTLLACFSGNF